MSDEHERVEETELSDTETEIAELVGQLERSERAFASLLEASVGLESAQHDLTAARAEIVRLAEEIRVLAGRSAAVGDDARLLARRLAHSADQVTRLDPDAMNASLAQLTASLERVEPAVTLVATQVDESAAGTARSLAGTADQIIRDLSAAVQRASDELRLKVDGVTGGVQQSSDELRAVVDERAEAVITAVAAQVEAHRATLDDQIAALRRLVVIAIAVAALAVIAAVVGIVVG